MFLSIFDFVCIFSETHCFEIVYQFLTSPFSIYYIVSIFLCYVFLECRQLVEMYCACLTHTYHRCCLHHLIYSKRKTFTRVVNVHLYVEMYVIKLEMPRNKDMNAVPRVRCARNGCHFSSQIVVLFCIVNLCLLRFLY